MDYNINYLFLHPILEVGIFLESILIFLELQYCYYWNFLKFLASSRNFSSLILLLIYFLNRVAIFKISKVLTIIKKMPIFLSYRKLANKFSPD